MEFSKSALFSLIVLFTLACAFLQAAAPSLVSDYDLQLERHHDGQFIPLDDGSVLAVNVDRVDGVFSNEIVKLDATGNILTTFPQMFLSRIDRLMALSREDGKTLVAEPTQGDPPLSLRRADGTIDPGFTSPFDLNSASISGIAPAEEGKVLVYGNFRIDGTFYQFVKLLPDGSLDEAFNDDISGAIEDVVSDGPSHFLLAGIISVGNVRSRGIQRITLSGEIDPDFETGEFDDQHLYGVQRLSNGDLAYVSRTSLGRANPDGTPSAVEVPDLGPANFLALKKAADGSLFVTGSFGEAGVSRRGVVKLTVEGIRDADFPELADMELEVLKDGSLLVVGDFVSFQGEPRFGVARLDTSGNLISGFAQRFADDGFVSKFDRFSDGSILIWGDFQRLIWGGEILPRNKIAKLTPEGHPDESFSQGFDGQTPTLSMLLPDDRFLVRLKGPEVDRPGVVTWKRYFFDGSPDPSLSPEAAAAYPLSSSLPGLTASDDGTISYFGPGTGNDGYRHTMISPAGDVQRAEVYQGFRSLASLKIDQNGTYYYLYRFGSSSSVVRVLSREGISLPDRGFTLPGPGNSPALAYSFGLLPGRNLLVSGNLSMTDRNLTLFDIEGTFVPQFEGKKFEGGIGGFFTVTEKGQIFVVGIFQSYDGVVRPNMAQVRLDGSLEPAFDLGSGPQFPPGNVVALGNGDLLIGGERGLDHPFLIDGIVQGGIARVRPVAQNVEPIPAPPFQVSAAATSAVSGVLNWKTSPGALGILIERKRADGFEWDLLAKVNPEVTHYEVDLAPATSYLFRISTYNLTGESPTVISLDVPEAVNLGGRLSERRIDLLDYAQIDTVHRLESGKYLVGGRLSLADDQLLHENFESIVIRLNSDGSYDASFQSFQVPSGSIRTLAELPDGKIWIGKSTPGFLQLLPNGELDETFSPVSLNDEVTMIHPLPDEKVLVAGRFDRVPIPDDDSRRGQYFLIVDRDGQVVEAPQLPLLGIETFTRTSEGGFLFAGDTGSNHDIVRFRQDGTHDDSFLLQGSFAGGRGEIRGIHQFPSGEILVGGDFTRWRWTTRPPGGNSSVFLLNIAVINPDGSLNIELTSNFANQTDGDIEGIGSFPSGKALILGDFTEVAGEPRGRLAIIGADGVLDEAVFDVGEGLLMRAVETMSNGEVFPVGSYGRIGGVWRSGITRFSENEGLSVTPDASFQADLFTAGKNYVKGLALAVSPSGELYVGGSFEVVRQGETILSRGSLVRILENGEIDTTYHPLEFQRSGGIEALALDGEGDLVIGGTFQINANGDRRHLARLKPSGVLDFDFALGSQPNSTVNSLFVHDDDIYLGGLFDVVGTAPRARLARVESTGALDSSFASTSRGFGFVDDIAIHGDRVLALSESGMDVRNFRGETDETFIASVDARGSAVRSFGELGFAVMGQRRVEGDTNLPSIAMITTEPDFGVLWEEKFSALSEVSAYSKMPGSFYASGNLVLGDRETSVVSIDPASGLKSDFLAGKANGDTSAVERFGDQIVVAGVFTKWGDEARNGLAFLESATAGAAPGQPAFTSVTTSTNHTLLRWDPVADGSSYRIESRADDENDWQTVGYQNESGGGFVLDQGTDSGSWSYRLFALGIDGVESPPSDPVTPVEMSFGLWKFEKDLPADLGINSDLDEDGIPLLVEYALDLDPEKHSQMPSLQFDAATSIYQINSIRPDVRCLIQISGNMIDWNPQHGDFENVSMEPPHKVSQELALSPNDFFRVSCQIRVVRP